MRDAFIARRDYILMEHLQVVEGGRQQWHIQRDGEGGYMINGMKSSGKKRDNLGSIGKDFRWECNSIAESATKKEGNQPSFFVV